MTRPGIAPATAVSDDVPRRLLVDGAAEGRLEILDRGLQYGDGLFETIRIQRGRPCQWRRHLDRLLSGAGRLGIEPPDPGLLLAEALAVARDIEDGVLKLILTRGAGGRGYRPPMSTAPSRLLMSFVRPPDQASAWRDGIALRLCRTPASVSPALAGIKHLNRLDSVLARREWQDHSIAEGLMLDPDGWLVGGTMTNVFLWDGRRLATPCIDRSGVAGTVRALVAAMASDFGIQCAESRLSRTRLETAPAIFLTNSIVGVWPARMLEGRPLALELLPWPLLEAVREAALTS